MPYDRYTSYGPTDTLVYLEVIGALALFILGVEPAGDMDRLKWQAVKDAVRFAAVRSYTITDGGSVMLSVCHLAETKSTSAVACCNTSSHAHMPIEHNNQLSQHFGWHAEDPECLHDITEYSECFPAAMGKERKVA